MELLPSRPDVPSEGSNDWKEIPYDYRTPAVVGDDAIRRRAEKEPGIKIKDESFARLKRGEVLPVTQEWNPELYGQNARYVSRLGAPLLDLLDPRPGERILDLGCGDGVLTHQLAERGCEIVGVDSSPEMVEAALALGVDARVMDGHELSFEEEFDAVFSNAALHWMKRPDQVVAGVKRALKPGGRFVGEFGGHGNIGTLLQGIQGALAQRGIEFEPLNPWYFPTAEEYRERLEAHGLEVTVCALVPRPTPLETDLSGWLTVFAGTFLNALPESEREPFLADVTDRCRDRLYDPDRGWWVDYVRLRFAAVKPTI